MATTQYIGARYVPVFADPAEWNSKRTYEPLMIVQHEGNSYTSKQYVPVGVDILNEDFWANTGNYNAQVEQYRRDTENVKNSLDSVKASVTAETTRAKAAESTNATAISNEVSRAKGAESTNATAISNEVARAKGAESTNATAISNEVARAKAAEAINVAIIGDSYTASDSYYFNKLSAIVRENVNLYRYARSATGFVRETAYGNGTNIPNRISELLNSSVRFDIVIMYAAINDYNNPAQKPYSSSSQWGYINSTQEANAIKSTMDKLRSASSTKRAQIIWIPNSIPLSSVKGTPKFADNDYSFWYKDTINKVQGYKNLQVIKNGMSWLMFCGTSKSLDNGYGTDKVHPNDLGSDIIATNMKAIIEGTFVPATWSLNQYGGNTFTLHDKEVACTTNVMVSFDGSTLTEITEVTVPSTFSFSEAFRENMDVGNLMPFLPCLIYNTTFEATRYRDGFYANYIGAVYQTYVDTDDTIVNKGVLAFDVPASKPVGSTLSFCLVYRSQLC